MTATWRILTGDARERLADLPAGSVHTCVTSPPYFGLRDYGSDGQIGLEGSVEEYVSALADVFRAVRRVLRDDGTVWLNLGDSYCGPPVGSFNGGGFKDKSAQTGGRDLSGIAGGSRDKSKLAGLKPKDLIGVPWRVAFALQADGWWLRSEIIWSKPNPMPESVTDRPTRAHEQVFLLAKSPRYFFDADAIREPHAEFLSNGKPSPRARYADGRMPSEARGEAHLQPWAQGRIANGDMQGFAPGPANPAGRNKRSVWSIATQPYAGAHFATFPPKLIEPCILAGSPEGGTVLDPFAGSGTTGVVALRHNRSFIGCELNGEYVELARNRIRDDAPLLNTFTELEPA